MPAWCGWREDQLRGTSPPVRMQAMAVKQAMNISEPKAPPPTIQRHQSAKIAAVPIAAHLQKASVSDVQAPRQSNKRHRLDSAAQDLTQTRKHVKRSVVGTASTAFEQSGASPARATKSTRHRTEVSHAAIDSANSESRSGPDHALSVFAPITSMDVLDSTSARTSLGSVKASGSFGCTIYQASSTSTSEACVADSSRQLLTSSSLASTNAPRRETESTVGAAGSPTQTDGPVQRPSRNATEDAVQRDHELLHGRHSETTRCATHMDGAPSMAQSQTWSQSTFDTSTGDDGPSASSGDTASSAQLRRATMALDSQLTIGDELDDSNWIAGDSGSHRRPRLPRNYKQNTREVDEHEDYGGALVSEAEKQFLNQRTPVGTQDRKPIVRQVFPRAIVDRSPIAGASKATVLRTCFRLGEALNAGSEAVRTNSYVMIELYARVTSSWREPPPGQQQHFAFADLYHDKAPHLEGTFELVNQATLWQLDSQAFLGSSASGKLCRAIVRLKRDGHQKWRSEILSIWEASWDDVDLAWKIMEIQN